MTATASSIAADVTVVGAGAAGLYTALCAARTGARVALVSATPLAATASYWAQGGLAAALAEDDSPEQHLRDTEVAGRGAVRPSAARVLVDEAPDKRPRPARARRPLRRRRRRRARRSASRAATRGAASRTPAAARPAGASSASCPRSSPGTRASSCSSGPAPPGCTRPRTAVSASSSRTAARSSSRGTVLATGGAAALWSRTTNPPGSLGIGLGLAHAAGADLADLEFLQFHPTAVIGVPRREGFLVTEAIRGEGATLHGPDGERFVDELAPRDEVARAIVTVLDRDGRELGRPRHARRSTPRASRTSSRRCKRTASIPTKRAHPGLARRALHDGRRRHGPRTRAAPCRACSPSARRPAPGCTARTASRPTA